MADMLFLPASRVGIALRRETPEDLPLTRLLYAAARADQLARVAWPPAMTAAFLDGQAAAQRAHYAAHHPEADRWIVTRHTLPIGRLYADRTGPDWRLLDIVLLPEARGSGLGTALVGALVRAARAQRAAVALQVARDNPRAEALYRRLGFVETPSGHATHKSMRRALS